VVKASILALASRRFEPHGECQLKDEWFLRDSFRNGRFVSREVVKIDGYRFLSAWHSGSSWEVHGMQANVSHKSEMAGPFSRGDTIINKTFNFI
jgi:hypothetical protein